MRWRRFVGPASVLVLLVLAEIFGHGWPRSPFLAETMLFLTLPSVAYTALKAGFLRAAATASVVALYALHEAGPHARVVSMEAAPTAVMLLAVGLALGWPMSRIRRAEARMRRELQRHTDELEARNRELAEANASLESFAYVVSHDLKEPVRAIENYLDAAREEWPAEGSRALLDRAYEANERLTRLLHGLLSYARTSSLVPQAKPIALAGVLRSDACRAQYEAAAVQRGATIEIAEDLPWVLGDEVVLAQLLGNLLLNAIRHNPSPRPAVVVRTEGAGEGRVCVVVADNGPGFPREVLERFAQLGTLRPATIKSGFGLVIAHRAAQRMGGRMWLTNPPEGGGEVHLDLPQALPPSTTAGGDPAGA